jgi:hypothetical protein
VTLDETVRWKISASVRSHVVRSIAGSFRQPARGSRMRRLASALLGIVAAATVVTGADARHRDYSYNVALATNDAAFRRAARAYAGVRSGLGALVPRGWHAAPREGDVR